MVQAQGAAFNKYIRMMICSYLEIKDALKMKNLSSKERLNFTNSAIARDKRILKLDESIDFSIQDPCFKNMINQAVDLS